MARSGGERDGKRTTLSLVEVFGKRSVKKTDFRLDGLRRLPREGKLYGELCVGILKSTARIAEGDRCNNSDGVAR